MAGLYILRGSDFIADGIVAWVDGCPLADCDHLLDVVSYIRASTVVVLDRTTKTRGVEFSIRRQHLTELAALQHAIKVPELTTGLFDLAIWWNDGTNVHKFTASGAGWESAKVEECYGLGTVTTYRVTVPSFVQTIDADATPITYDDDLGSPI